MGHAVRSIAAPPAAVDAMFRQAGVIQVDTLDEMFDVAQLLAHQPLPAGPRVAVVGNSDALGLLAADAAAASGLSVTRSIGARRRGDRGGLRGRPRRGDRRRRGRRRRRDLHPADQLRRRRGRERPRCCRRAVRQADGLQLPRSGGRSRAAAGARPRRQHRRPGVGAVVPSGGAGGPRARPRRRVRRLAGPPARGGRGRAALRPRPRLPRRRCSSSCCWSRRTAAT